QAPFLSPFEGERCRAKRGGVGVCRAIRNCPVVPKCKAKGEGRRQALKNLRWRAAQAAIRMILQRFLIRLLTMLVTLFGVAVVVIRIAPGDPIAMMLPPGASQADIDRLRALYGLDKSPVEQFFIWLSGVAHGDFGTSISLRQNVLGLVMSRLPATLELSIV